jgi:probable F420-dependent oxidoreductase
MEFWIPIIAEDQGQMLEIARAAEAIGFAGVALADHVAVPTAFASKHPSGETPFDHRTSFPDPLTCIAAMAAVTTRLRFLTYVYVLPMRDPFSVAKQAGTVALLSGHRLRLGVGAGWLLEEIGLLGFDPGTRGRRMDEMIEVMRRFWRDGTAEFHGEFYDFGPTGMYPAPGPLPVWIGGRSDAALRRAARNDGWVGMNYDRDEIPPLLRRLREERRRHVEATGASGPFETLVLANAEPSRELYRDLEAQGVTSTIALAWPFADPAFAPLERKLAAMEAFGAVHLREPGVWPLRHGLPAASALDAPRADP